MAPLAENEEEENAHWKEHGQYYCANSFLHRAAIDADMQSNPKHVGEEKVTAYKLRNDLNECNHYEFVVLQASYSVGTYEPRVLLDVKLRDTCHQD